MGLYYPKPYKQRNPSTGKMEWVTPPAKEFNPKPEPGPRGIRHDKMSLILLEKFEAAKRHAI